LSKLIILGTSSAVPDLDHENTHMAIVGKTRKVLVDTGSSPTIRLLQAGLDPNDVTDLFLTHFHPDHVSGVPSLLMNSWLTGRKHRLQIYGLADTNERMEKIMQLYEWSRWPDFYPVSFQELLANGCTLAIDCPDFRIYTSLVCHMIPALGLRIESPESGQVIAYSCDTEPCASVIRLAEGADILIHEASGASLGHSSPAQAGEIATTAKARHLVLIHYPTGNSFDPAALVAQARQTFSGPITVARDFMEFEF
jgi:ribonuclease Z